MPSKKGSKQSKKKSPKSKASRTKGKGASKTKKAKKPYKFGKLVKHDLLVGAGVFQRE